MKSEALTKHDLVITGGTIVAPRGRLRADLYMRDGTVSAISSEPLPAESEFDARGRLVMPGFIDAHVHFMDPGDPEREDFPSASAAALVAGVTTVVEHTHGRPVRNTRDLTQKVDHLVSRSQCDFALGAHAWPGEAAAVGELVGGGISFIKAFTCTTHGVPGHDRADLRALLLAVAEAGGVCLVHCEDQGLTARAEAELRSEGRTDGGIIPAWRNREAELTAVAMLGEEAAASGARVVLAHASSADVIREAEKWREKGARIKIESCPQYLTLMESEVLTEGALRKFTPPARAQLRGDLAAMWSSLATGRIDYISSDHAPSTRRQKLAAPIWEAHFGLPGIDTTSAILLDGAARHLVSYRKIVEAYSTVPAETYGLEGKGSLEVGADADVVIVDPGRSWTVRDEDIRSRAGWSPYSGRTFRGRPVATFLRGRLAMRDGEVLAEPGWGRFIRASVGNP